MKRTISTRLCTIALLLSSPLMLLQASAAPASSLDRVLLASQPLLLPQPSPESTPHAPIIYDSGVRGTEHFIQVAVYGSAIHDLQIKVPAEVRSYQRIEVENLQEQPVLAQVQVAGDRVIVTFDQPLQPGSIVEVGFEGIEMTRYSGETLFYEVSAGWVSLNNTEIPVGNARVNTPLRG